MQLDSGFVSILEVRARGMATPTADGAAALRMLGQCSADLDDDFFAVRCYLAAAEGATGHLALPGLATAYNNSGQPD